MSCGVLQACDSCMPARHLFLSSIKSLVLLLILLLSACLTQVVVQCWRHCTTLLRRSMACRRLRIEYVENLFRWSPPGLSRGQLSKALVGAPRSWGSPLPILTLPPYRCWPQFLGLVLPSPQHPAAWGLSREECYGLQGALAEAVSGVYSGWASIGSSPEVYMTAMSIGAFHNRPEHTTACMTLLGTSIMVWSSLLCVQSITCIYTSSLRTPSSLQRAVCCRLEPIL